MQAIILAAGKGSRLGQAAEGLPKCLLQIGGGTLIRRQLDVLAEAGVSPVLVVTGYAADLVRESVGGAAEFILNPRYEKTNSLHSFFLTRDWVKGPALIFNSDVLADPRVLEALLKSGEDSLAFDSLSGYAPEHMKVAVSEGRVTNLSKTLSEEETSGENVGMLYLSRRTLDLVFAKAEEMVTAGRTDAFLAAALRATLGEVRLKGVDIAGIPWTEIDTPQDLDRARRELWPQIADRWDSRGRAWKGRRRRRRVAASLALAGAIALAFAGAWLLAPKSFAPAWETVSAPQARQVTLNVDGTEYPWWWLEGEEFVSTEIEGPRTVRIDLRCLVTPDTRDRLPYVAELRLDGKRHDWHRFRASPDPRASYPEYVVCDKQKMDVDVPPGRHSVGVRLLAGDPTALLVRFRVIGQPEE